MDDWIKAISRKDNGCSEAKGLIFAQQSRIHWLLKAFFCNASSSRWRHNLRRQIDGEFIDGLYQYAVRALLLGFAN